MLYSVCGPQRTYKEVILDDGTGPSYDVWDWYYVEANTKKEAAWAAYRRAKENGDLWYTDLYDYEVHPLSGVVIERMPDELRQDCINDGGRRHYINTLGV